MPSRSVAAGARIAVANDEPRPEDDGAGAVVVLLGEAQESSVAVNRMVTRYFIDVWQRCI